MWLRHPLGLPVGAQSGAVWSPRLIVYIVCLGQWNWAGCRCCARFRGIHQYCNRMKQAPDYRYLSSFWICGSSCVVIGWYVLSRLGAWLCICSGCMGLWNGALGCPLSWVNRCGAEHMSRQEGDPSLHQMASYCCLVIFGIEHCNVITEDVVREMTEDEEWG